MFYFSSKNLIHSFYLSRLLHYRMTIEIMKKKFTNILQYANDVFICKPQNRACSEIVGDTCRKLGGVIEVLNTEASV